jgi:glutamate carboxypeptidase
MAGEEHLTFNPGVILGGTSVDYDAAQARGTAFGKTNVIAGQTVVSGDLRTLSPAQLDRAMKTMQEVTAGASPRSEATLSFGESYPPLAPTDGNARLLAAYDRVSRDLGFGPVIAVSPDTAGAADVSFIAGEVTMILDGVGLMGHDDHTPGETADLSTLPSQTKRAAITIYRLTRR